MYAILHDFGSEGMHFYKREENKVYEVDSIDKAFKTAIALNYTAPFEIVKRIKYEVKETE